MCDFFLCLIPTNKTGQIDLLKIAQTPVVSAGCPLAIHGHNAIYAPLNICGISDEETSFWTICHMIYMHIMLIMKIQTKAIHFTQSSILTHLFLKILLFTLFFISHPTSQLVCILFPKDICWISNFIVQFKYKSQGSFWSADSWFLSIFMGDGGTHFS